MVADDVLNGVKSKINQGHVSQIQLLMTALKKHMQLFQRTGQLLRLQGAAFHFYAVMHVGDKGGCIPHLTLV